MKKELLNIIASLRICIEYLGEKEQFNWWDTSFYSNSSTAFLTPVFNKTPNLARYHTVREAALKIHDKYIGVGASVFHLFRLPEYIEKELHEKLNDTNIFLDINKKIEDKAAAMEFLNKSSIEINHISEGPYQIGEMQDINDLSSWGKVAFCYNYAFQKQQKIYPYFVE